jgi:acetyltransferase-like isoleucine patch superfamily enzyme
MGHDVRITKTCRITCAGNIKIGDNVLMGPDVMITDHNHGMDPTYPGGYSPQPLIVKNVTIKDGCWIGQRACILPGVTVGAHSIIGAGSVVTHDIPDFCIVCGVPARVIKKHNGDTGVWEAE